MLRTFFSTGVISRQGPVTTCPSCGVVPAIRTVSIGMASSSVPVECLFSSAALIANGKRSSLEPYKLEQILFVHDNFGLAKDSLLHE